MKKIGILALVLVLVLCVGALCACGGRNYKEELPGEWYVWHWYYNTKDGENGFFEEAHFYTFGADGKLTIKIGEEVENATYEFTKDDTIKITHANGTVETCQLIESKSHPEQIQMMNVDTIYTLTLQPMSTWQEK